MSTTLGIQPLLKRFLLWSSLLLSGCLSMPDSIKTTVTPEQDFMAVYHAPQRYTGQIARFGGKVVSVHNGKDGSYLEIAVVPLDSSAEPRFEMPSLGRLLAKSKIFLEPTDFNGQFITVVGPLTGVLNGKIGEMPYAFVTMDISGYQRWKLYQEIIISPHYIGQWNSGIYPNWRPGYISHWYNLTPPARVQTSIIESP